MSDKYTILSVCTEWNSYHGGLPTFNREFCLALARAGHKVICHVAKASADEIESANSQNVTLVAPVQIAGLSECCHLCLGKYYVTLATVNVEGGELEQFDTTLGAYPHLMLAKVKARCAGKEHTAVVYLKTGSGYEQITELSGV